MSKWLPRSLFSRLVVVLLAGLVAAQAAGLAIYWRDRDEFMLRAFGVRSVQRIADILRVLDDVGPDERKRLIGILNSPQLRISADIAPLAAPEDGGGSDQADLFTAALRRAVGDGRPFTVVLAQAPFIKGPPAGYGPGKGTMMMGAGMGPGAGGFAFAATSFVVQTRLNDRTLITLDARQPRETESWPYRLVASLAIVFAAVVVVALIAVRWVTRPLKTLAGAAEELGENIDRPPLDENGPLEVARAARAFNNMQKRLSDLISERARVFAAMSHDLKTPITRLRLRAELLDDATLAAKFESDLKQMEQMVTGALDLVRGLEHQEPAQEIDINALVRSVQEDAAVTGGSVEVQGTAAGTYLGRPQSLRRCLANLVDNAVHYGRSAVVQIVDTPHQLEIQVRDRGPGIPEPELARVFEPFYRVEQSRSRDTGGTGLGLTIARNIVHAHGGEIVLRNLPQSGLQVGVILPR